MRRRKSIIFFLVFGICSIAFAVALNVGWILLNLQEIVMLVFGIIFFALIITGLILNLIFLIREIKKNEQQNVFLNAMTHELKTPIASIKLYLETLKTREVSQEKQQEFYDVMLADSDRLLTTVETVLQAGKIREKSRKLNISKIDLRELLADCIKIVRTRYKLEADRFEFSEIAEPCEISGDYAELQTAFNNLLDNAVKYSTEDIKISVRLRNISDKQVQISIRDSGIGLSAAETKKIFRRFYRVSNDLTQRKKGTGLGLFIVESVIKKHGGSIRAKSAGEGKGTTFIIRLPKNKLIKV
ncbi:MAG: sensor histidine kinase [Aridibacter sp.]